MAKNVLIAILFIGFIGSLAFGLFKASEVSDRDRRIILAEEERKRATEARIKAEDALRLTRDTLEKAYLVATNAKRDAAIAHLETQKAKKQYESIHFRAYTDSQRDSVWTALYPTGDSIR